MESLHEAGLAVGIGLGDVLHVRADEDQTAGAALAFAGGDAGADTALSSFKFGLFFASFSIRCRSSFWYRSRRILSCSSSCVIMDTGYHERVCKRHKYHRIGT